MLVGYYLAMIPAQLKDEYHRKVIKAIVNSVRFFSLPVGILLIPTLILWGLYFINPQAIQFALILLFVQVILYFIIARWSFSAVISVSQISRWLMETHQSDLVKALLDHYLERDALEETNEILEEALAFLSTANPWDADKSGLLQMLFFTVWNVGEYGMSLPRTVKKEEQFAQQRAVFISSLNRVWWHILNLKNKQAVQNYALALADGLMALNVVDDLEWLLARIYDVMEDGTTKSLLSLAAIQELVCSYRHAGKVGSNNADLQNQIDNHVFTLAAIYVEIGGNEEGLGRLLANGGLNKRRYRTHQKNSFIVHRWLHPNSYIQVANALGLSYRITHQTVVTHRPGSKQIKQKGRIRPKHFSRIPCGLIAVDEVYWMRDVY